MYRDFGHGVMKMVSDDIITLFHRRTNLLRHFAELQVENYMSQSVGRQMTG